MMVRSMVVLLMGLSAACAGVLAAGCAAPEPPGIQPRPRVLLTLIAHDDPRATHGEPLEVRIAANARLEEVARKVVATAAKLGYTSVSAVETHAQVAFDDHVYDCVIRLGSNAEIDAWEAATPGDRVAEEELADSITIAGRGGSQTPGCYTVESSQESASATLHGRRPSSDFRQISCTNQAWAPPVRYTMYRFQRLTGLGNPAWAEIGLVIPGGFRASAPRCTRDPGRRPGDPPIHRLVAILYKS